MSADNGIYIGKQGTDKGADTYPDEFWVIGYWVDNEWVGGGRHPWEISKLTNESTRSDS